MPKKINWVWVLIVIILVGMYVFGLKQMYFHQDDLDWFLLANHPWLQFMGAPIADHINYVWRILLKLEWDLFGLHFAPYYTVSVAMHACVVWLLYRVSLLISRRRDLACASALLFVINTNWTETVLWISGQTILITVVFVLLGIYAILQQRREKISLTLASLTSSLALGFLGATFMQYKKHRWTLVGIGATLVLVYLWKGTDSTHIEVSWRWIVQVGLVMGLAIMNSVVGRLIIPFDRFELARIWIVVIASLIFGYVYRLKLKSLWSDQVSRFLIWQIGFYYLIVAIGRAQFGVGIMRAERYAYLGLALLLLLGVRILRNMTIEQWWPFLALLVIVQSLGFYQRAMVYVQRPQGLRQVVSLVEGLDHGHCYQDAFLPHFVLNDERLHYTDLNLLLGKQAIQMGDESACLSIPDYTQLRN